MRLFRFFDHPFRRQHLGSRPWPRRVCAIFLWGALASATVAAAERPNILLMVSDDQGWWDVGVNGNPDIETPTLDRLASEGVNLTRFYAAPVCSPTRAGLMTGRYALRTGVYNTRFGGNSLQESEVTMAEVLKQQGYRTGLFGKWPWAATRATGRRIAASTWR